ncbi:MAG: Ig-like domain-containing protein [Candidatus Limnocylindria bacterium]
MDGSPSRRAHPAIHFGALLLSRLFRAALAALSLAAALGLPSTIHAASPAKVAIIVGPVGTLTPTYLALADAAAAAAEQRGAVVARAYSPYATPGNVLAAVADAQVVIYFGHGYGHPSPYGGLNTAKQNGWALQGPASHGTHGDAAGEIAYYGEDWIVANARPAPGFVMIYSNTCYAPGASEGGHEPASAWVAAQRVAYYSRAVFAMGGSAYFATDFDRGAADLVGRLLGDRAATFGSAFVSDHRFVPSALTSQPHPFSGGQAIWLHRSKYTDGPPNYWYAFAGNPDLNPMLAWDQTPPTASLTSPEPGASDVRPGAKVTVQLSEPVIGISTETLSLRDADGEPVAFTMAHDPSSLIATLTPDAPLTLSSRYAVVVTAGIRDLAGRALEAVSWSFVTRLDADPLSARLPIVLESGSHELLRFEPDGTVAAHQALDVVDRRWLQADRRARLVGQHGSWLEIDDPSLGRWWVAESSRAHALGLVEEVALTADTRITLPPLEHLTHRFDEAGVSVTPGIEIAGDRVVTVDRRRVLDGRTFLRMTGGGIAGAWIESTPAIAQTEASARRVLATTERASEARLVLEPGLTAFRFDRAGRVVDRRTLSDDELGSLVLMTRERRIIGGSPFAIVASGELGGWALPEGPGIQILAASRTPDAAD